MILSVGTAVPSYAYSQEQILSFVLERFNIHERTRQLYRKVFANPSVEQRYIAVTALDDVVNEDHDIKNRRFEKQASQLGAQALARALTSAQLKPSDVDFLVVATCTGYVCPGLSSHIIEQMGLNPSVHFSDLVGMGCAAAIPAIEQAHNFAVAHPGATAAVICSEVCSAALVSNDDPDIVISNALFADGAAAVLIRADAKQSGFAIRRFGSYTLPHWRDQLRFVSEAGYLRNVLRKEVPQQAAQAVSHVIKDVLGSRPSVQHWILHAGGQKVLDALAAGLKLTEEGIVHSRTILRRFGNMSSPTVLFVLEQLLKKQAPRKGDAAVMSSFGAGFSAHAVLLEWI